jgi:hypothetical protein
MDAPSHFTGRSLEPVVDIESVASRRDSGRTLSVTAVFHLSEEGRKASLLDGGDGRTVQEVKVAVPTNRFHLVSVDAEGVARLRLQPRFYLDDDQNVVRNDAPPTYDAPPTVEELLKDAARNHQLERAYHVEQAEKKSKRRDEQFEIHQKMAEEFLADPTMRALEHPKPTPRQSYLQRGRRQVLFDAKVGHGLARQVPPEAYRRFSTDLRERRERNMARRGQQLALHEEKQRAIAEWVARRGTPDQQVRHAAGVLPLKEVLEGMADEALAVVGDRPRYVRDGVERLQAYLRKFPRYTEAVVTTADLVVTSANAEHATEEQWALTQELRELLPDAELTLRVHRLSWNTDPGAPNVTQFGVLVTRRVGPFTVRREYLVGPVLSQISARTGVAGH